MLGQRNGLGCGVYSLGQSGVGRAVVLREYGADPWRLPRSSAGVWIRSLGAIGGSVLLGRRRPRPGLRAERRGMAQGTLLKGMPNGNLLRISDCDKTFSSTDIEVGDSAALCQQLRRKSAPGWRGPAIILDFDDTGATAKFQRQTFKIARASGQTSRGAGAGAEARR